MAISPPEGFTLTTPPSSTPPEGFNLLNKPAIERPPLPSSEEMFNSPNTWRNDLRSMDVPNRMLLASSAKKVQASQFLSEQTGIKQETIFDNYEQFSQEYRYSGNHEADWQHISGHFKQIRQIKEARAELAASGIRINGKTVEMFPVDFPKEMTPERFGELFKKLSEYNKDQDFAKAALKSKDPKGFVEALKDGGVPVLDLPKELQELQLTLNLAEAFEQDPSLLDDNQLLRLAQNVGEMQRPSTVGGMVGSILTELPEVGLSFFLSGGAGTATKAGLKKSINAVVSKGIQEKIQKNLLTRGITKVAGGAIAAAARTPVASVPFAPKTFIDKLTPDMGFTANEKRELSMIVTGEGKSVPEAFKETILDSYIEVASEMVGGAFKPLGQGVKQILVKSAFARAMLNANPTKKVADLAKLVNKTGYHGPLGEMLEERAGDAARALVGLEDWAMPSKNQLLAELIVFSIPAAGLKTADFLLNAGSPGMPAVPSAQQWDGMLNYFTEDQIKERYGEIGVRAAQGDSAAQVEFVDNLMGKDIDPDKVVDIPVKPVDIPEEKKTIGLGQPIEDVLIKEAKKYKTADEFVDAYWNTDATKYLTDTNDGNSDDSVSSRGSTKSKAEIEHEFRNDLKTNDQLSDFEKSIRTEFGQFIRFSNSDGRALEGRLFGLMAKSSGYDQGIPTLRTEIIVGNGLSEAMTLRVIGHEMIHRKLAHLDEKTANKVLSAVKELVNDKKLIASVRANWKINGKNTNFGPVMEEILAEHGSRIFGSKFNKAATLGKVSITDTAMSIFKDLLRLIQFSLNGKNKKGIDAIAKDLFELSNKAIAGKYKDQKISIFSSNQNIKANESKLLEINEQSNPENNNKRFLTKAQLIDIWNKAHNQTEGVETKIIPQPKPAPGAAQDEKPLKRTTQLKHASIDDDIRPRLGLEALDPAQRQTSESLYQEVIKENLDEQALGFAVELIKKPVPISAKEHHAMVLAEAKLERLYEEQSAQASEQYALGLNENGDMYSNMAKATLANIDVLTRANRLSGTEISRAFNARKIAIEKERYKLVNLTNKATAFKRESLTQEEKDKLQTLSVKVKEQTAKIAELEAALEKAALEKEEFDAANAVKEFAGVKNQRKKNTARQEREELKEELRKLGMQINDITNTIGLSVEISNILSRIAITHIEEGATTLKEVVRRVQQDVPEASKRDIFNSLGGRVKAETKRVEKEITKRIRELKTQANLEGQIIDAIKGDFDAPMNKKEATKKVKHLRGLLNNLKASAYNTVKDDAQLKKIHLKINEVQDQLTKGYRHIQTKRKESGDITAAKKEYHELKRLMDTLDAISDLQEQLRLGPSHYKISAPRKRVVMNEELNQALVEKKKLEQEIDSTLADLKKNTFWGKTKEVLYTSRAMMAMADFSYALRQAGIFAPRNPILAAKIFGQAFSVTFDHDKALLLDITMRGMPEQIERDKHGLWLSSFDKGIHESEEVFLSRLIDKTPIYRSISRGSERNMVIGLNLFRIAKFDSFIKEHPESTYEQRPAYAHYINVASGRGDLAQLTAVGRQLSALFFAPRFAVSRFQAPWQVVKNWQDPLVRNEILKDFIPFVMTGMAVLTMASLAGLTVELDPEDSDFGKIVWGDTRIDIWGGLLQPARLVLKAILSLGNTTGIRELEEDIDLWDAGNRFLNYKSSPAINLPITLITGKNIINQEQGLVETIMRGMTPLIAQETYDVWENTHRVDKAAAAAAMTALGIGVQEHSDN